MYKRQVFDGISEETIWNDMTEAKKVDGFTWIGDGKDGTVGGKSTLYDLSLIHIYRCSD